jgi:hypothetical protein
MDDITVPSLSSGIVGSRFVSQDEVDAARTRRDEQWRAAYARSVCFLTAPLINLDYCQRLGQEPPPRPVEDSFDGRSLAEVSLVVCYSSGMILIRQSHPQTTVRNLLQTG